MAPIMISPCVSRLRLWLLLLVSGMLATSGMLASGANAADDAHPLESADTTSPRATLTSFLESMYDASDLGMRARARPEPKQMARLNRILGCLDLSQLPPALRMSLAKEAAVCLKEVLDRIELPAEDDRPNADEVVERELTKWTIPHTEISIVKVSEGPREGEFLMSAETVERATEFYEMVKHRDYIGRATTTPGLYDEFVATPGWMISRDWIPEWSSARWFGQAIWQWAGLALTLLVALALMLTIYLVGRRQASRLRSNLSRYLVTMLFPITAMLVPFGAQYFVIDQLQIYGDPIVTISFVLHLIFLFALIVFVISIGNRLAELIIATPWIQPAGLDAQLVRLTCRMLSIVGTVAVVLEGGRQLEIPLTTLLAGVSVSGLALALAAQDSLKNVLGSMMIMLDKPFKVGERIATKGFDGVVEDIGLRSTKIRLLTGHQVSIPNEEMARAEIENIGRRPHIRRAATIELPSELSSAKIKRALEILRTLLVDHEGMVEEFPPRVFLRDVNKGSIGIFMIYWYHPPDYWDFLAFSERVTLQMSEQFEAEGIPFAAPALTVHMQSDVET